MSDKPIKPPVNWGNDPLSDFVQRAYENTFATYANLNTDYDKLRKIDAAFRKAIENSTNSSEWFALFFLLRAHSSYLGSARLAMSTQVIESYMVLRGCLEAALYGFFIAKDPSAKKTWLERNEDKQSLKKMKTTFQIGTIFSLLNKEDEKICGIIKELYERTIEYGAHPNPNGLLSNEPLAKVSLK